jgi:hypothetical protein
MAKRPLPIRPKAMSKQEAQQLIKQLVTYQKEVTADRDTALAALERAGLVTKDGRPTEFYAPSANGMPTKPRTRRVRR